MLVYALAAAGLVILIAGADLLVRGASRLATAVGISPLVVGLTVVAFGTSAPELAISVQSGLAGQGDLAVGNVIGSNIFNVLLILGLAALVAPLFVAQQLLRLDVPLMVGASIVVALLALDGSIDQREGLGLAAGILAYTFFAIRISRREGKAIAAEYAQEYGKPKGGAGGVLLQLAYVLVGLAMLVVGSRWLVDGAVRLAEALGVSQLIIGLTIVAAGTSLPEVATSVVASFKGERDIAVGNVVGSCIFNLLCVLGIASAVTPGGLPVPETALHFDIPVMVAVAIACLPILFTGNVISRWEGAVFFAYYLAYTAFLVLEATGNQYLREFEYAMLGFAIPLTVITIAVVTLGEIRTRQKMKERTRTPVA